MGWGDEIIASGEARQLQQTNPLPVRIVDQHGVARWNPIWDRNPRIARLDFQGPVQTLINGPHCRPYVAQETPGRWFWNEWECPVGEIYLTQVERRSGRDRAGSGLVVIEPNLKPKANPNKHWGKARWEEVARQLRKRGHRVVQLGPRTAARLRGADLIQTHSFRDAVSVLARAKLAILPEGGLHHAAAALNIKAVVIFGGYISPKQTGYPMHVNLFTGGEACGLRTPCEHCKKAMNEITPDMVVKHAFKLMR